MSQLRVTVQVNEVSLAEIKADVIHQGGDGHDTYKWEWGIQHSGAYLLMDEGELQHRDCDGALTLLAKILRKQGVKL